MPARFNLDITPILPTPALQMLRDSIELNNRKIEAFLIESVVPTGAIMGFETSSMLGYLLCDGNPFDTTMYVDLYAYLGTNILPDYRDKVLVGRHAGDADFGTLGGTGGSKGGVSLHSHDDAGHTHYHFHEVSVGGSGNHDHVPDGVGGGDFAVRKGDSIEGLVLSPTATRVTFTGVTGDGGHGHTGATLDDSTVGNAIVNPSGATNGNLPPYRVVNWFIKT